jgi:hypothetical protein
MEHAELDQAPLRGMQVVIHQGALWREGHQKNGRQKTAGSDQGEQKKREK